MADIERLVATKKLKMTRLNEAQEKRVVSYFHYDPMFDALMIMFVPPETETVVHYIDHHVALLYEPDTREIVGIQVEAFERSFLSEHDQVRRVWRLSDATDDKIEDLGDMILAIERRKPEVAREVIKASRDLLGIPGEKMVAAFASD